MSELQPTTMKDIAEHFGVSIATVSRALNGSDRVSQQKRQMICDYAHAHNFYPNDLAKSLRNSHKQPVKVIGVIVPEFTHYYFSSILNGIEDAASRRGYRIIATTSREKYEREVQLCQMFEATKCAVSSSRSRRRHRTMPTFRLLSIAIFRSCSTTASAQVSTRAVLLSTTIKGLSLPSPTSYRQAVVASPTTA